MTRLEAELTDLIQRLRKRAQQLNAKALSPDGDIFAKAVVNLPAAFALAAVVEELEVTLGRIRHG